MNTAILPTNFESFIFQSGDDLKTTSLKVAEAFQKRHDDVLKKLRSLECSADFNARNFAEVEYTDAKGEKRPAYEMTKNGFMFLVMGFTGKAAAQIKEAYINAFDAMHAKLFPKQPTQHSLTDYINAPRHNTPAIVPELLNARMTAQQKIMMLTLASRADENGQCQISIGDLAPLCGIERSTTSKNLTDLVEAGFLTVIKKRYEHGGSQPNTYTIPERFRMVEGELLEPVALTYQQPEGMVLISEDELGQLKKSAYFFDDNEFYKCVAQQMTEAHIVDKGNVDLSRIKKDLLAVQSKTESVLNYLAEVRTTPKKVS